VVLCFFQQSGKVLLSGELIGNRVQVTSCRATVSNTKGFTNDGHCANGKAGKSRYKSGYLPFLNWRYFRVKRLLVRLY